MATLNDLDIIMTYLEDKDLYRSSLYHRSKDVIKPKAIKCGPVIWIMKDGKPLEFNLEEKRK